MAKHKRNVNKAKGKATAKTARPKSKHSVRQKPTKGTGTKTAGNKGRKTSVKKTTAKSSSHIQQGKVPKQTSKRTTSQGVAKAQLITERRQRGKEQTDFHFEKVRSVNKKIAAFDSQSEKAIANQLSRKGGKPPKGIIVTVRDKKGREHTRISKPDFVVNKKSVKKFTKDMLTEMRDDFMEWKDMQDEPQDQDDNPYKDYNPDTIHEINIKYIY